MASRIPISTRCDPEVWDRARATVAGMLRHDPRFSLAELIEHALEAEAARLEEQFNGGERWSAPGALPRGRRLD